MISVLLWCAGLFVCINTENFGLLWEKQIIQFHWDSNPRMSDLLSLQDFRYYDKPIYLIQKVGHFSGFFGLTLLAVTGIRTSRAFWKGIVFAAGYAVLTELLQPFFGRDGRIVDMFIDGAGIALAAFIAYLLSRRKWRAARQRQNRPYPEIQTAR